MKKLLLLASIALLSFNSVNAEVFNLEIGGDSYYVTDNASIGYGEERAATNSNLFKDKFSLNTAILSGRGTGENWSASVGLAVTDGGAVSLEQANLTFRLVGGLWLEGGAMLTALPGEFFNYTWDNWLTNYSLFSLYCPNEGAGVGLIYNFSDDINGRVRVLNSGFDGYDDNNLSKSVEIAFQFGNLFDDWTLGIGAELGNEEPEGMPSKFQTFSTVMLTGHFAENLEGMLNLGLFTKDVEKDGATSMGMSFGANAQIRYTFAEKYSTTARVAYMNNEDGIMEDLNGNSGIQFGLGVEYKPSSFSYIRLEGNYLSMSGGEEDGKMFLRNDVLENTRMDLSISAGVYFDLLSLIK